MGLCLNMCACQILLVNAQSKLKIRKFVKLVFEIFWAGLRKDDKVLSVNGHSCVSIDHYEAVGILKAAGNR